jgi:hypothetical protein
VPPDFEQRAGQITRLLSAGEHVVIHRYNRALVEGHSRHVRLSPFYWFGLPLGTVAALLYVYGSIVVQQSLWLGLVGAVTVVLLVGATVYGFMERARLDRHGCLLTAEVTDVDVVHPPPGVNGVTEYTITYSFLTPDGDACTRTTLMFVPGSPFPVEGAQLAVLYADGVARVL